MKSDHIGVIKNHSDCYIYGVTRSRILVALLVSLSLMAAPSFAAVKAGAKCSKAGTTATASGKKFTCVKSGTKLVWNKGVAVKAAPKPSPNPVFKPVEPTPAPTPIATQAPAPVESAAPAPILKPVMAKKIAITCVKGKLVKKVSAVKPKCPAGYKKK